MGFYRLCILFVLALSLVAAQPIESVEPARPEVPIQPLDAPPVSIESDVPEYDESEENVDEFPIEDEGDEMYAREFPYGEPLEKFKGAEDRSARMTSRKGRAHIRIVHKYAGKPRNYAKKYRTWMPSKEWIRPIKQKKGPKRLGPPIGRKPGRRREGSPPNRRKKHRPNRGNSLRKPIPPPEPDYEYFSEEEYFPEESKRNEFNSNERRPPHKKQNMRRKPGNKMNGDRFRPSDDYPSVSYSNFVQHPASSSASYDYADFVDDEPSHQSHSHKKDRRKKKKKRKGDRKKIYDRNEDQFGANSESIEETNGLHYEKYPPYVEDPPLKRPSRHPQPTQQTPLYGDGYIGHVNSNRIVQNSNRGGDPTGLGRYRNEITSVGAQTFGSPQYEPNNINNFGVSNNHPQPDIITQQNYNQFVNQGFSNNNQYATAPQNPLPQNYPQENFNRPVTQFNQNYNRPAPPQQATNAHTLQNVIPNNRGNEYSSKYKSNSFFDNTETFQDFNQNVNFNQNKAVVSHRPNKFVPSTQYEETAADAENEFINRHLDLYSNGMTGVPTQGDGRQDQRTKDYDIGYGEIQYDETHRT